MWRFSTRPTRLKRSPASTLACKSPAWASISGWRDCTTNVRGKGLLGFKKLDAAIDQLKRTRDAADDFFARIEDWYHRQPANFNGRVRNPIRHARDPARGAAQGWPRPFTRVRQEFEQPEERIELDAADMRCRALADEISAWLRQAESDNVYWVELEEQVADVESSSPRHRWMWDRSYAACCSTEVPTCVLTSATLCVGSPPKFDFIKSRLGFDRRRDAGAGQPF